MGMSHVDKLLLGLLLTKQAKGDVVEKDKPTLTAVKLWDTIKGIPTSTKNTDETNPDVPTDGLPTDIQINNKQIVAGTGNGPLLSGSYSNT